MIKAKRSSVPKYLHQDLPKLQHMYIKEILHDAGKIECPPISYFENKIKLCKEKPQKPSPEKKELRSLREQFQYALIFSDPESNVFDELLGKSGKEPRRKSKRQLSERTSKREENEGFFGNTIDLVIRHRKKELLKRNNEQEEP